MHPKVPPSAFSKTFVLICWDTQWVWHVGGVFQNSLSGMITCGGHFSTLLGSKRKGKANILAPWASGRACLTH